MRRPHYLKANKGIELPSELIFFDTETWSDPISEDTVQARLKFGWACYIRRRAGTHYTPPRWFRFETSEQLWDWVEEVGRDKTKLYMFAHNLAFDASVTVAVRTLQLRGWTMTGAILDDPPTVLKYRKDARSIVLMDTLNIFRMSLRELGKYIGILKYEFPTDDDPPKVWDQYCKRDVLVLFEAMRAYWALLLGWELGNFQYTLPAQAMAAYRHRFMDYPIYIDDSGMSHELSRDAYAGGRVECFQLGKIKQEVYCVDINSQYPAVMATDKLPTKLQGLVHRTNTVELNEFLKDYLVVADVEIETDEPVYPLKWDGKLLFPVGRFRTQLATPELRHALDAGRVGKVYRLALYHADPIFHSYVDFFYHERLKARDAKADTLSWLCKLFLNSLYGKFGQTGRVFEEIELTMEDEVKVWVEWDATTRTLHKYRQLGGLVQEQRRDGESRDSFPAIAAHVTSAARLQLWELMAQAEPDNVFYCDTDSLFVNAAGLSRLQMHLVDDELGALKLEWQSTAVEIRGPKDYSVDGNEKIKGIRKDAERVGPNTFRQDVFRGWRGMIRAGDVDRQLITKTEKTLRREYQKGLVQASGRVRPFRFPLPNPPR